MFKKILSKKNKYYGFTLVELIIVITILAILATIAFVSFSSYTGKSRDSNRLFSIKEISKALEIQKENTGKYPFVDGSYATGGVKVSTTDVKLFEVGVVGKNVSDFIKLGGVPLDPKTNGEYLYGLSDDNKHFQLAGTLENEQLSFFIDKAYADGGYNAYVEGNYLGALKFNYNSTDYIANIPSLIFSRKGTYSGGDKFVINGGTNLPYIVDNSSKTGAGATDSEILKQYYGTGAKEEIKSYPIGNIKDKTNIENISKELGIPPIIIAKVVDNKELIVEYSKNTGGNATGGTLVFNNCNGYNSDENINDGFAGGDGTLLNPYLICNAKQLKNIGDSKYIRDKYFKLISNIDLLEYSNWTPIGWNYPSLIFKGNLDGNNKKIINLNINRDSLDNVGLFGVIDNGSEIKSLDLEGGDIIGKTNVGGLFGRALDNNIISNISIKINNITGYQNIGGLGGFTDSSINNIISEVNFLKSTYTNYGQVGGVLGMVLKKELLFSNLKSKIGKIEGDVAGGIIGRLDAKIINSSSEVDSIKGNNYLGGIIGAGYFTNCSDNSENLISKFNYIEGGDNVGGIAGRFDCGIKNSKVEFDYIKGKEYVGGFIGSSYNSSVLDFSKNSVNYDLIQGTKNVGGFGGRIDGFTNKSYTIGNNIIGIGDVGGFLGNNLGNGNIEDCYSIIMQDIKSTGTGFGDYLGGFIGENGGTIKNSYVFVGGNIIGTNVGSFAGGTHGDVINSYVNNDYLNNTSVNNYYSSYRGDRISGLWDGNNWKMTYSGTGDFPNIKNLGERNIKTNDFLIKTGYDNTTWGYDINKNYGLPYLK